MLGINQEQFELHQKNNQNLLFKILIVNLLLPNI
jgi:hypothetical protein